MVSLDDLIGPSCLCATLFGPMALGGVVVPLALWLRGPVGYGLLLLVLVDYLVPLAKTPWPFWYDMCHGLTAWAFRRYFPQFAIRCDAGLKFDSKRRYLLCAHPHGIFGMYVTVVATHLKEAHKARFTAFAAPVICMLPLARRHFSWLGMEKADAPSMRKRMRWDAPHNVCYSTPGGIEECFCVPHEQVVVQKRKGFCKIAIQCGCDLVPIYGFGNNQMFPVVSGRRSLLAKVSKALNVTLMAWVGRGGVPFSPVPTTHPQLVAVGAPIPVEQCDQPSNEQIEQLHARYCAALRALFDKHKTDPVLEKTGFAQKRLYFEDETPP